MVDFPELGMPQRITKKGRVIWVKLLRLRVAAFLISLVGVIGVWTMRRYRDLPYRLMLATPKPG
jgi:hypothetical protein